MACEVLTVDSQSPDAAKIRRAAEGLRAGGLVAFPTETVYGLGADALDAAAVGRIFAAKGRPPTNPIIVHVPEVAAARTLVSDWPPAAQRLAESFWPGPLTLVLRRLPIGPDVVTAGGPTVALRVPAHPVALAILRATGVPIAAPSANRSTRLSPTRAEHVLRDLGDRIDLLVDGGPTPGGLESTVLDVTTVQPRLLRPGLVRMSELESVIGPVAAQAESGGDKPRRSPGMLDKHYAPQTPLELTTDGQARIHELGAQKLRVAWLTFTPEQTSVPSAVVKVPMPYDAKAYSARLYAVLHNLDALGLDRIVVDLPPDTDDWLAVHDRLRRAAETLPPARP